MSQTDGLPNAFGKEVLRLRLLRGWSQEALADKTNLSPETIRKIEKQGTTPQPRNFSKLARAFGLSAQHSPEEYARFHAAWVAQREDRASKGDDSTNDPFDELTIVAPDEIAAGVAPGRVVGTPPRKMPSVFRRRVRRFVKTWRPALNLLTILVAVVLAVSVPLGIWFARSGPTYAPGGIWITPETPQFTVDDATFRLVARAYPGRPGGPAITYVNFTATWPGPTGGWRVLCEVPTPRPGTNEYECNVDLVRERVPSGTITVSFDVYDTRGNLTKAPHGLRTGTVGPVVRPQVELRLSTPTTLSTTTPTVGQVIEARFVVRNLGKEPVLIEGLTAGVREGDDWAGQVIDFPTVINLVLAPGQEYTYAREKAFLREGQFFAEPAVKIAGKWMGIPEFARVYFTVAPVR